MPALVRASLRRRILRDARGLAPSVELPWMPPWGSELADDLIDVIADVHVLHADVAHDDAWIDDAHGALRRSHVIASSTALAARCDERAFRSTAHALREIAATLRAWESMAPPR